MKESNKLLLLAFLFGQLCLTSITYSQTKTLTSITGRLEQVHKLIEASTGAQQVQDSGMPESLKLRDQARLTYQQAEVAAKAEQIDEANILLNEASILMFKAVRAAGTSAQSVEKKKLDYKSHLASVETLLDAYQRIREEKKTKDKDLTAAIMQKIDEAKTSYESNDYLSGKKLLDEAYSIAKTSIEGLRGGDTLVRELNFSSPEEEYDYEIDRNETHTMLVKVLLQDKPVPETMAKQIAQFRSQAVLLRSRAEQEASRGDYKTAIKTLEESTKNLVKAIRGAGIYIPG